MELYWTARGEFTRYEFSSSSFFFLFNWKTLNCYAQMIYCIITQLSLCMVRIRGNVKLNAVFLKHLLKLRFQLNFWKISIHWFFLVETTSERSWFNSIQIICLKILQNIVQHLRNTFITSFRCNEVVSLCLHKDLISPKFKNSPKNTH